jgi:hypothetical protein
MKRLILLNLVICLFIAALSSAAIVYGRYRTGSSVELDIGFTLCDDEMPCFLGVVPGVTSWSQTVERFEHLRNAQIAEIAILLDYETVTVGMVSTQDQAFVTEIYILSKNARSGSLSAASVILRYGQPCVVGRSRNRPQIDLVMWYPRFTVVFTPREQRLDQTTNASQIIVFDSLRVKHNASCEDIFQLNQDQNLFPWRGFTSLAHYTKQ